MPTTYAIPDGRTVMAATTWTSAGGTETISNAVNGVSFQPDFLWMKNRTISQNHYLVDSNRGISKILVSNTTSAEATIAAFVTSFNSNGFSLGADGFTAGQVPVGWQWKANGAAVSNTAGSITSQVSAGVSQGFSVVTYTGTGANATVGHGLGVAPKMVIVKRRNTGSDWPVWHTALSSANYLAINTTAASTSGATIWNSTSPTSSVFSVGTSVATNGSADTYVAYCFSEVAGYSKFGSYTGNGSADGPFVYLGFRPRWVLVKRTDTAGFGWHLLDSSRNEFNVAGKVLIPNSSAAESDDASNYGTDFLSNGFKSRTSATGMNASGGTYIYAAFAENPFKYSNAR